MKRFSVLNLSLALALSAGAFLPSAAFSQDAPQAGVVEPDSLAGTPLTYVSWGAHYQEVQMQALEKFGEVTGAEIYGDGPTEMAKVQAQVESGNVQWDVVNIPFVQAQQNCGSLFQPLDRAIIDDSKVPAGTSFECSVPSDLFALVLLYNPETYGDNPPKGWHDFFDVENFPGTRATSGISNGPGLGILEQLLIADGVAEQDVYPLDVARAIDKLRSMREHFIFWRTGAESQQLVESKEADMIAIWNGSALDAARNGSNYIPVWQGWLPSTDGLAVPVGVKNPEASFMLVNYMLGAEAQKLMAEGTGYSPVNSDVKELDVDDLTASWMLTSEEKLAQMYKPNMDEYLKAYETLMEQWASFLSGS
ncbi:extracellular solute-binding protein [Aliihoeflea sp. PC F10.4]